MTRAALALLAATLPLSACVSTVSTPPARQPPHSAPAPAAQPPPGDPSSNVSRSTSRRPRVTILEPHIKDGPPDPSEIPHGLEFIPDAVPRHEARSASGNPPEYEAFGELHRVLESSAGFRQTGRASWYGKKFQGKPTASGEPYDMFAMTAAHKTLPIPSYVRVTNLDNQRSTIVRINDRGPFHSGRIIDLSYAAANKLGIIGHGHVTVELVAVQPPGNAPPPMATAKPGAVGARYLQIAAYSDLSNARAMRDQLARQGMRDVDVRSARGGALHRVVIGPFSNDNDVARTRDLLDRAGYPSFPLRD